MVYLNEVKRGAQIAFVVIFSLLVYCKELFGYLMDLSSRLVGSASGTT